MDHPFHVQVRQRMGNTVNDLGHVDRRARGCLHEAAEGDEAAVVDVGRQRGVGVVETQKLRQMHLVIDKAPIIYYIDVELR